MLNGLSADLVKTISNLSFDLRSRHFSQSFAAVYDAELLQLGDLANAVACVVLLLATRNRPTTNLLSLFILLIYSLPCPSLYFFSIASHPQSSESTGSYLSFQYSSNSQLGYQVFKMPVFSLSDLSKPFGVPLVFLT